MYNNFMLRIVAGKYKSRKIEQPDISTTRPTKDMIREAVFSMFQFEIPGKIFLDLFAGSGAVGIEACSRGAMKVYCVEKSKKAIKVIKSNKEKLLIDNLEVIEGDVLKFITSKKGVNFDFIYVDPPYKEYETYNKVLESIVNNNILSKEAYIIIEINNPKKIEIPDSLIPFKEKKYGKTYIMVLTNNI